VPSQPRVARPDRSAGPRAGDVEVGARDLGVATETTHHTLLDLVGHEGPGPVLVLKTQHDGIDGLDHTLPEELHVAGRPEILVELVVEAEAVEVEVVAVPTAAVVVEGEDLP